MLNVRSLAASISPNLRPLLAQVAAIKLPDGDNRVDEFCDIVNALDPEMAGTAYDLQAYCDRMGTDYETLAERAAIIEYEGRRPRWMAEAMAILG